MILSLFNAWAEIVNISDSSLNVRAIHCWKVSLEKEFREQSKHNRPNPYRYQRLQGKKEEERTYPRNLLARPNANTAQINVQSLTLSDDTE